MGPAAAVSAHFHPHSCKQMVVRETSTSSMFLRRSFPDASSPPRKEYIWYSKAPTSCSRTRQPATKKIKERMASQVRATLSYHLHIPKK
ncbi:hypothetical protein J6590_103419 [Homalodisca vitripennis]|nr:hypothetical protein J6590_103419 [Homalodisca vitripennis]